MGTKVKGKIYIPGYFGMENSSVNSNGNVLAYHEENKPNAHLSDMFTITSSNGYVHYDKEMLKRTMLVHEATFQKQVYELHRLYKIQKDLMVQIQREEFSGCPRYADTLQSRTFTSQAPPGDVKGVWKIGTPIKQSSIDFMNESSSQCSVNGAPLRHNNDRYKKKVLDLELPVDVYADDDDDVEILDEKPSKSFPGINSSILGGNVKLNLGNSEDSSHVGKSWIIDMQAHQSSAAHILNKSVEESSNMKVTNFLGMRQSASQNEHYVPQGVNSNFLSMERNLKEKCVGNVSGSRFFDANKEIRHGNSFRQRMDDSNASMSWLKYKQNYTDSSMVHCSSSASAFNHNHSILTLPSVNNAPNSPWQSNNTSNETKNHHGSVTAHNSKHAFSNSILMDSTSKLQYHHSLQIQEETKYRKLPPLHDYMKDINLNDVPVDNTDTWKQGSENSGVDISWLRKEPVNLIKSQVPLISANGKLNPESGTPTGVPTFPVNVLAEKDSRCSPALQDDLNIEPSIVLEVDMEMEPKSKEGDPNVRDLIDLNEALLDMDDPEMNACESKSNIVPNEPNDRPSRDSLAITTAESLVAMSNVVVELGYPQLDTLHWFADLATSKGNTMFDNNSDDDFEALTLKLQETNIYEYHTSPIAQEDNSNNGHRSTASLLLSKPQRGKGRGRRQKKNFQKDILPSLASLPKHEVLEDLRALGRSKPVTPVKQRGRKRQQPRSVAVTVKEAKVSQQSVPPPLVPADLDADALGITRWGRTTRRCRRQDVRQRTMPHCV